MSDDICQVAICDRPTGGDRYVCPACISDVRQILAETPWMVDELNVVISRQARYTAGGIAVRSSEIPLPVNLKAAEVLSDLAGKLAMWVRLLLEENPGWRTPVDDPKRTSAWLMSRLDTIAAHVAGGELVEELSSATATGRYVIDRPAEKWYAGVCSEPLGDDTECAHDLYASISEGFVSCRGCGANHDIAKRRAALLSAAEDVLATASEAARAIVVWSDYERGESRLVKRIGMWAERGRIAARANRMERGRLRPTYRIGDILDLVASDTTPDDSRNVRSA